MKYFVSTVVTALVVGLAVVAYFKGWFPTVTFNKPQAVSTQAPIPQNNYPMQTVSASPIASPLQTTNVKAGGILSMSAYSIDIPSNWQYSKNGSVAGQSDKLVITNGQNSITISQGAFGGGGCLYPGDPDAQMAQRFTSFTPITDQSGDNLRVGPLSAGGFVVCQVMNGSWGDITSFGHISIAAPASPDQAVLTQINLIISSLKKL